MSEIDAKETLAKVKIGKMKIVSAPQDKVEELQSWVDQVLGAAGHPEAYVTDESLISDFVSIFAEKDEKEKRAKDISNKLGVSVKSEDCIIKIAERLRDKERIAGLGDD